MTDEQKAFERFLDEEVISATEEPFNVLVKLHKAFAAGAAYARRPDPEHETQL